MNQCSVCGRQVDRWDRLEDGRWVAIPCLDAQYPYNIFQETRDFLKYQIEWLVKEDGSEEDWAHLSRALVELGLSPLQPLEIAQDMYLKSAGVYVLEDFNQIKG